MLLKDRCPNLRRVLMSHHFEPARVSLITNSGGADDCVEKDALPDIAPAWVKPN